MIEEKVNRSIDCSWCLEEITGEDNVCLLEQEIILHESCYNLLYQYPSIISEGVYKEIY